MLAELPRNAPRPSPPPPSHAKTARAVHLGTRQCERVPRHGAPTSQRSGGRLAQGRFISSQRSRPRTLRHCHGNDDRIGGVGAHGHLGVHSQSASAGRRPAQRDRAAEASSHQGSAKSRRQSGCCRCAHTTPISCTCRAHAGVPDDRHWLHASDCRSAWSHASSPSVAELATGGPSQPGTLLPAPGRPLGQEPGRPSAAPSPPAVAAPLLRRRLPSYPPCPGDTPWLGLQVAHHAGPPSCRWPSRA